MNFLTLSFVLLFVGFTKASDEIINHINSLDTTWKAGKNFDENTLLNVKKLFMSSEENITLIDEIELLDNFNLNEYPSFDARTKWPNCTSIGQIFDQGFCSPSWIYAAVGQMADRICIKTGHNVDVEATVKNMMKGNYDCNSSFNSADIGRVFKYWSKKGIFMGKKSSVEKECLPFSEECQIHEANGTDINLRMSVYHPRYQRDTKRDVLARGSSNAHIDVYEDLLYYKSGVYQRTSNVKLGSHAVKVIGWGIENGVDYWLLANSWGTQWGDNGFFKIRRGSGELGISIISAELEYASMTKQQLFLLLEN